MNLPIVFADVEAAAHRIAGHIHRTPVLRSRSLDGLAAAELLFKAENLQRTGSFKARGAFAALSSMSPEERAGGVLAVSSGNHAQAIALAARDLGTSAVVVCPEGSNPVKVDAARAYGAEIVTDGVTAANREQVVRDLERERGLPLIHPFDDPRVMAGQGTCGLEFIDECGDLDTVVVPTGGGGLLSGVATAVKHRAPGTRVVAVEPQTADDLARSLRSGERIVFDAPPRTICDGVRALGVGSQPWAVIRALVDDAVTVADDEALTAMDLLWTRTKVVVEPSGALGLAAVLAGKVPGRRIGVILSGGNVDPYSVRPNQRS